MQTFERRDYHRMPDDMCVTCVPVRQRATNLSELFELNERFDVPRDLYLLDMEARDLVTRLTEADPALGKFAANVDRRLQLMKLQTATTDPLQPVNWSLGGVGFECPQLFEPGTMLAIKLTLANGVGLCCNGWVRHARLSERVTDQYQTGVQFLDLDETSQQFIDRYQLRLQAEERRQQLRQP